MAYIELNDLVLKIDNAAKDIDIVNYNSVLAKLNIYLSTLNNNNQYIRLVSSEHSTGVSLPVDAEDGASCVVLT